MLHLDGYHVCQDFVVKYDEKGAARDELPRDLWIGIYFATSTAGGCQVPSPAGKIDGGVSLGQYKRITR
jgi:hypothetical protein